MVVPGSSANLGPGFDVLAMALGAHVRMGFGRDEHELSDRHPARVAFSAAGGRGEVWFESSIPSGRGLGFSGAAIVAGTIIGLMSREGVAPTDGNGFIEERRDEILDRAATIEGHPDNVAASLFGGVVAVADRTVVNIPVGFDARLVVWVPASSTSTSKSRGTLGDVVTRSDAVFNMGRVLMLAEGLRLGDRRLLALGVQDRLHQETRFEAAPRSRAVRDAFVRNGAVVSWLSGSGPSVAALTTVEESAELVRRMRPMVEENDGRVLDLSIDVGGARQAT
ncbi:MAG: homoserine kinase [Actinomycetota bacterium]